LIQKRIVSIADLPLVTVVMPIRNEEAFIARSLGAVLAQDYPHELLEILVADGMSDDRTLDVLQSLNGAGRIRVISNARRIQAAGLNEAISQASGDIIIRVDGHTVIAPDYIRQCVNALQSTGAQNVGGPMDPVGITMMGKAIAAAGKSAFAVPSAFHISRQAQYTDTVYLGAWPRQVFEQVGLYSEDVGVNEDYELNYRIRKAGGKIYFSPAIRSQYFGRQTIGALARQYFRYGRSKVKMLRIHPESLRLRQAVAPVLVAGIIAGVPLAIFSPLLLSLWLLGLLAYAALTVFFSFQVAMRTDCRLFWRMPIIYVTIHVSWGTGFWLELIRLR
jgi:succinoglycan biosynthesis protein ExoA